MSASTEPTPATRGTKRKPSTGGLELPAEKKAPKAEEDPKAKEEDAKKPATQTADAKIEEARAKDKKAIEAVTRLWADISRPEKRRMRDYVRARVVEGLWDRFEMECAKTMEQIDKRCSSLSWDDISMVFDSVASKFTHGAHDLMNGNLPDDDVAKYSSDEDDDYHPANLC